MRNVDGCHCRMLVEHGYGWRIGGDWRVRVCHGRHWVGSSRRVAEGHGANIWGWGWRALVIVWKGGSHGTSSHGVSVWAWGSGAANWNASRARHDAISGGLFKFTDRRLGCRWRQRFNFEGLGLPFRLGVRREGSPCLREYLILHLSFDGAAD